MRGLLRRRVVQVGLVVALVLLAGGLWAFQPWRLWTRSTVDEALPEGFAPVATTAAPAVPGSAPASDTATPTTPSTPVGPRVLAEGAFVSQEHTTSGTARVLEQGGDRVLRLEGFSTSDGPDLFVWLSAAEAGGSWGKYDDGRYVSLGKLKATDGNHNYAIPADVDLAGLRSAVIWCDRFNVSFGSAALAL
ncbi:DM13 domain-containing protein [Actinokineospora iranica]|uniref:Electron transfer DM13 n=1 Tax=Actinokineospora iranica TaxID=1271860 RepID=A0A1G6PBP8_9PSEU|nr:DM13 domain-containing protein [Actinokineospora iranica]SDC77431.1 Electron transfer DM13 [Actinokineospora iranica]